MSETPDAQRGFSLLETLVALAIVAMFCGAMLPAAISSLERLDATTLRATALLLARSQLERHAVIAGYDDGMFEGREGELAWSASITRIDPQTDADARPAVVALRRIHVDVFADRTAPLASLTIYRIGRIR